MKKVGFCLLFAVSASLAAFGLTDVYWVGGTSGDWSVDSNWSSGVKPNSADCHVYVTNDTAVTISLGTVAFKVGGLSFSNANHVVSGSANNSGFIQFSGGAELPDVPSIDVPDGLVVAVNAICASSEAGNGISKTGGGELVINGYCCKSTTRFSVLEIASGKLTLNDMGNFDRAVVRSGATMVISGLNKIADGAIIHLEEGATFDNNGQRDALGGFTGQGVVTNLTGTSNWTAGPLDFGGRVYGAIMIAPDSSRVTGEDGGHLTVGASDTLANATVKLAGYAAYTNVLRFVPGVGSFEIQSLDFGTSSHAVACADTDGDPITLKVGDLTLFGAANFAGIAVLDIQDGAMEVNGSFNQPSSAISASAEGRILFNGGVLRAGSVDNQSWWTGANDPNELAKAYIGPAGAAVDVKSDSFDRLLTIGWPFVTGVENGTDGGLVKLGRGALRLSKPYAGTGAFEVREGRFEVDSGMGATPFGTAQVQIGSGEMSFPSAGSYSVTELSYTNCATLRLSSGVALTVGPGGAAADSAVARSGHGVLTIMSGTADTALGANASVTVNGGLSNDATTGILRQPIFERRQTTGGNPYRARFLTCDANNKLVPVTPEDFNPTESDSSTVAQITGSSAVTVSANASVGALVVERSRGAGLTNNATLSVGQNAAGTIAPILLNSVDLSGGSNAKADITGTGTIDFGASEGLIVLNSNASLLYPVNIENAIAGSGGVTFAAPTLFDKGIRGHVVLTKASTYTGGTWIENAHVVAWTEGCLGTGTIHVSGSELEGGALEISAKHSSTFTNSVEIAGCGPVYSESAGMPWATGALIVRRGGVTLSGGLTLVADAKIASGARGGPGPVTFSAPIVGPGKLTVCGASPFRFSAANTYAGGTVITNGTVEVTDLGTLGSGPVKICSGGVLRFVNASAKTVANVITGDGRIEMNGAAVTLAAADGFKGDIAGNFSASGDDGYAKYGEGTVALTNSLDYAGATTISAGTLRLGPEPLGVPAASESIAFHLDASAGDTITEEDGAVVSWADADGRDIAFTNVVANGPSRVTGALNGMDALYFNGEKKRRLMANAATPEFCTVFFVNCVTNVARPSGTSWSNMGIIGEVDKDNGLRFYNQTSIKTDNMFFDGVLHIDGDSSMSVSPTAQYDTMTVPRDKFIVTEAEVAIPVQNVTFAIGDYLGGNSGRSYLGDIAEVIAYDRWLTDEERVATERYLQNKWGLKAVAANGVFTNVLPVATALTVAEGATVDLAGGFQEVASLSGAGTVANTATGQATLMISSGTSEFSGSFSGDVYLEVAAGATLDLCGGTITVGGIGGSGRICNGTVVVSGEIRPGGRGAVGTLTFETAPVVAGATLVVDGDGAGGVGKLAVEGAFDMTGLSLSVPAPRSIVPGDHAVVESGVALSGEFYATDLPDNGKWSVAYTATAAVLSRRGGMLIIVQ